jgi:hypothetical protein
LQDGGRQLGRAHAVLIVSTFPTRYFGTGLILSWLMMDDPNPKLLTDLGKRKGISEWRVVEGTAIRGSEWVRMSGRESIGDG